MSSTVSLSLDRYDSAALHATTDAVAAEEPLEIRVEGQTLAVVMRTPGDDRELVAGFLLTEGVVSNAREIFDITACVPSGSAGKGNVMDAALRNPGSFDIGKHLRHGFASASCGVCGKQSIDAILRRRTRIQSALTVPAEVLLSLPDDLSREQSAFKKTGGLHACALFTAKGEFIQVREDIGRHNALDKLIGWAMLSKFATLRECVVLLSGRTSFEMMQKAYAAGIPIVASISAPSSLAVSFARESGQTLAGFVRGTTMNLYAGVERVTVPRKRRPVPRARTTPTKRSSFSLPKA